MEKKGSWLSWIPFLNWFSEEKEKDAMVSSSNSSTSGMQQNRRIDRSRSNQSNRSQNHNNHYHHHNNNQSYGYNISAGNPRRLSLLTVAKASLEIKRRLRLDPDKKLFFIYEPGKQVSSAIRIKNVSKSYVAFKFQTNAPKSCFMRPPGGILAPKESLLASVTKFVEAPENQQSREVVSNDKFKIVSLKVKQGTEYAPELFDEHREYVAVERILRVIFLDPQRPCQDLEKLKKRLAEAEALKQTQKKPQDQTKTEKAPPAPEGVLDEWKERREKYLAKQQEEVADPS